MTSCCTCLWELFFQSDMFYKALKLLLRKYLWKFYQFHSLFKYNLTNIQFILKWRWCDLIFFINPILNTRNLYNTSKKIFLAHSLLTTLSFPSHLRKPPNNLDKLLPERGGNLTESLRSEPKEKAPSLVKKVVGKKGSGYINFHDDPRERTTVQKYFRQRSFFRRHKDVSFSPLWHYRR